MCFILIYHSIFKLAELKMRFAIYIHICDIIFLLCGLVFVALQMCTFSHAFLDFFRFCGFWTKEKCAHAQLCVLYTSKNNSTYLYLFSYKSNVVKILPYIKCFFANHELHPRQHLTFT